VDRIQQLEKDLEMRHQLSKEVENTLKKENEVLLGQIRELT